MSVAPFLMFPVVNAANWQTMQEAEFVIDNEQTPTTNGDSAVIFRNAVKQQDKTKHVRVIAQRGQT